MPKIAIKIFSNNPSPILVQVFIFWEQKWRFGKVWYKCSISYLFYDLEPLWQKMGFQLPDKSARKTVENEVESLTHRGQTPRIIVGCVVSCARTEGSGPSPKITTLTYPNLSKNSCWRDLMIWPINTDRH